MTEFNAGVRNVVQRRRWVRVAALLVFWLGMVASVLAVMVAILGLAAGTDDPHGGGLLWAVGVGILPGTLGVLALGVALRIATRERLGSDPPAG